VNKQPYLSLILPHIYFFTNKKIQYYRTKKKSILPQKIKKFNIILWG